MHATDEDRGAREGGAERLLRALRGAAEDLGAAEALSGLGDRARVLVDEVSRAAAAARSGVVEPGAGVGEGAVEASDAAPAPADLERRLGELRACVDEVADLLDAGLERLEALEMQFGDPAAGIEARLAEGIERCERSLGGVEHRLRAMDEAAAPTPASRSGERPRVLVVCASSLRRADLCLDLEREGLDVAAAPDPALALRCLRGRPAHAVLLVEHEGVDPLVGLEALVEAGVAPGMVAVLAVDAATDPRRTESAARGPRFLHSSTRAPALAAALLDLARSRREGPTDPFDDTRDLRDVAVPETGGESRQDDPAGAPCASSGQGPHAQPE